MRLFVRTGARRPARSAGLGAGSITTSSFDSVATRIATSCSPPIRRPRRSSSLRPARLALLNCAGTGRTASTRGAEEPRTARLVLEPQRSPAGGAVPPATSRRTSASIAARAVPACRAEPAVRVVESPRRRRSPSRHAASARTAPRTSEQFSRVRGSAPSCRRVGVGCSRARARCPASRPDSASRKITRSRPRRGLPPALRSARDGPAPLRGRRRPAAMRLGRHRTDRVWAPRLGLP